MDGRDDPALADAVTQLLTVVLGAADAALLVQALTTLAGSPCDSAPAEETE